MRRSVTASTVVIVVLVGLGLSACTAQTAAPPASTPLTPTASAQFVSPSALSTTGSAPAASSPDPTTAPTAAPATTTESTLTSAAAGSSQPTLPLGSVLPEVVNPTDPQEIADRQAVEAAWIRFWDYYPTFEELSPQERQTIADSIAVDPLKTQILEGAANADANGEGGYGTVTHRISWYQSVDGEQQIAIADCMDQDQMGTNDRSTGKKLSKGYPRTNLRGDLELGADDVWRVRNLYYLTDETC